MQRLIAIITLAVCLLPLRPAVSQVADSSRERGSTVDGQTAGTDHSARKSPGRAVLYSAGGTILLTPILVGPIVGPSFGHFYADANGHAWRGIALRSGGVLLGVTVLLIDFASLSHVRTSWEDYVGNAAIIGIFGHAVYDIVTAWHSATDDNRGPTARVGVVPAVGPDGEQAGLALRLSF